MKANNSQANVGDVLGCESVQTMMLCAVILIGSAKEMTIPEIFITVIPFCLIAFMVGAETSIIVYIILSNRLARIQTTLYATIIALLVGRACTVPQFSGYNPIMDEWGNWGYWIVPYMITIGGYLAIRCLHMKEIDDSKNAHKPD